MLFILKTIREYWKRNAPFCAVCLAAFVYTVFFTAVSFARYNSFSFSDFDFAIFVHENWKILHGRFDISVFNHAPIWGNSLELISALTAPVFFLSRYNPESLLLLQSLFLGLGAVPIFMIARKKISENLAAGLAISYLLNPSVWYANLYEYNPLVYATFTLLMAFYFLEERKFKFFTLFILLSLVNRADLSVVTLMFGVYALLTRMPWRWVLMPGGVSILWVLIGVLMIIPAFKGDLTYDSNYPQFGQGFGEIIKNMVLHPGILGESLMTKLNAQYFFQILLPVSFLSLIGIREFLICALSLLQHLVSCRAYEHTISYHYTSTITPFVYISAVYGLSWLIGRRPVKTLLCLLPVIFAFGSNCGYGPLSKSQDYLMELVSNETDTYNKGMMKAITPGEAVVSTFAFSPMLAGRQNYYSFHYIYSGYFTSAGIPYHTPPGIEDALIDFNDDRLLSFNTPDSDVRMRKFLSNGHFGIVDRIDTTVLFKKDHQSPLKLYETRPAAPITDKNADAIRLDHFEMRPEIRGKHHFLDFTFHWRVPSATSLDLYIYMAILDDQHHVLYGVSRPACYGLYPSFRWKPSEEIVEYYDMLLPSRLCHHDYKLYMFLFKNLGWDRSERIAPAKYLVQI